MTEGELSSREDSPTMVSFGYFRTKSGLPPSEEKKRASSSALPDLQNLPFDPAIRAGEEAERSVRAPDKPTGKKS